MKDRKELVVNLDRYWIIAVACGLAALAGLNVYMVAEPHRLRHHIAIMAYAASYWVFPVVVLYLLLQLVRRNPRLTISGGGLSYRMLRRDLIGWDQVECIFIYSWGTGHYLAIRTIDPRATFEAESFIRRMTCRLFRECVGADILIHLALMDKRLSEVWNFLEKHYPQHIAV